MSSSVVNVLVHSRANACISVTVQSLFHDQNTVSSRCAVSSMTDDCVCTPMPLWHHVARCLLLLVLMAVISTKQTPEVSWCVFKHRYAILFPHVKYFWELVCAILYLQTPQDFPRNSIFLIYFAAVGCQSCWRCKKFVFSGQTYLCQKGLNYVCSTIHF